MINYAAESGNLLIQGLSNGPAKYIHDTFRIPFKDIAQPLSWGDVSLTSKNKHFTLNKSNIVLLCQFLPDFGERNYRSFW